MNGSAVPFLYKPFANGIKHGKFSRAPIIDREIRTKMARWFFLFAIFLLAGGLLPMKHNFLPSPEISEFPAKKNRKEMLQINTGRPHEILLEIALRVSPLRNGPNRPGKIPILGDSTFGSKLIIDQPFGNVIPPIRSWQLTYLRTSC